VETSGARRVSGRAARPRHSTRLPTLSLPARVLAGDRYGTLLSLAFPLASYSFLRIPVWVAMAWLNRSSLICHQQDNFLRCLARSRNEAINQQLES